MSKVMEVKVPDIGDYRDVPVIEVLVKDGERVEKDQPLLVLESDKATLEVPAPAAGIVLALKVKAGAKLSQGDLICRLETAEAAAPPAPAEKASPAPSRGEPKAPPPAKKETSAPQAALPLDGPAAASGSARVDVKVPDIGDYKDVPVIEVLVKDGDTVAKDAPLLVLESDKATLEVPAPAAGTVRGLKLKVGDKVSKGEAICVLEGAGAVAQAKEKNVPSPPRSGGEGQGEGAVKADTRDRSGAAATESPSPQPAPAPAGGGGIPYAGPATRKFARQLGVDLSRVQGSGPRGRIVIEDVQNFVRQSLKGGGAAPAAGGIGIPPIPAQDFSQFGDIETRPLARIRKLSAAHLQRAWLNVPHVTQFDEADITELEAFRKSSSEESGTKLTLLPFIMKAVAVALKQFPEFNSSLAPDGENLILKKYCHIGFAADTPNGLVVPVVRDVWQKGIVQLAKDCSELASKARDGKLKGEDMKGGCFSISSLGGLGVTGGFTPIVNAPEVAILGVSRATMKPVWDGKSFQPRLMLPLSLSYDHRVIDGAYAARFTVQLTRSFADLRRLML
jgi:pyruvate dehydrogenase E2 component (dihydrolipoamide acetyltransferase)